MLSRHTDARAVRAGRKKPPPPAPLASSEEHGPHGGPGTPQGDGSTFDATTDPHLQLEVPIRAGSELRKAKCDLLDTLTELG